MIQIQNTQQLDAFVRSTKGIYTSMIDMGRRMLGFNDNENRFARVMKDYFRDLTRSRRISIDMNNIQFRQLAKIYIAESRAFPRIR